MQHIINSILVICLVFVKQKFLQCHFAVKVWEHYSTICVPYVLLNLGKPEDTTADLFRFFYKDLIPEGFPKYEHFKKQNFISAFRVGWCLSYSTPHASMLVVAVSEDTMFVCLSFGQALLNIISKILEFCSKRSMVRAITPFLQAGIQVMWYIIGRISGSFFKLGENVHLNPRINSSTVFFWGSGQTRMVLLVYGKC